MNAVVSVLLDIISSERCRRSGRQSAERDSASSSELVSKSVAEWPRPTCGKPVGRRSLARSVVVRRSVTPTCVRASVCLLCSALTDVVVLPPRHSCCCCCCRRRRPRQLTDDRRTFVAFAAVAPAQLGQYASPLLSFFSLLSLVSISFLFHY